MKTSQTFPPPLKRAWYPLTLLFHGGGNEVPGQEMPFWESIRSLVSAWLETGSLPPIPQDCFLPAGSPPLSTALFFVSSQGG